MGNGGIELLGVNRLRGPLAFLPAIPGAAFQEEIELVGPDGGHRAGRVLAASDKSTVLEVFGATQGLSLSQSRVRFRGRPFTLGVGRELLGRTFDGTGKPRDGLPPPLVEHERPIEGSAINPSRREYPRDFLETGFSSIDGMNTLVLGQKLPVFTEPGLPHDALVRQLLRQARAPGVESFAVVFAALGLPQEVAMQYEEDLRRSGAFRRAVAFLNLAGDPAAERLMAPRCALTAAEYLAFDLGMDVLVVLHDITAYGEALREMSSARGEAPSRKGYPGYLYSDLACLFERAGRIRGRPGSITQIPVVTVPAGDLTHPIPDLTGYVTEGQIVLDRELHRRGVYPPVSVLPSLSRLMDDGIGAGRTRADHAPLARQLYASCARAARTRELEAIIGREELTASDRRHLAFLEAFEKRFLNQGIDEARTIGRTLDIARELLKTLADDELARLPQALLAELRK